MLLYLFTVLLNNNHVRPITAELVECEIPQKALTELLCLISDFIYYH